MPGIFGIIGRTKKDYIEEEIQVMMDSMMYEPFLKSTIVMDDKLNAAVGVYNHKGSFSDCMPVWNEDKEILRYLKETLPHWLGRCIYEYSMI